MRVPALRVLCVYFNCNGFICYFACHTEAGLIEVLNLHPGADNRQQDRVQHIFAVILMVLAPPGSGHKGPWLRLEVSKPR